jgi:hypothetical protein
LQHYTDLEERILKTTCVYLQNLGEHALAALLAEGSIEFIPDHCFGNCGLTLKLPPDSMIRYGQLRESFKDKIEFCLRKVSYRYVTDQNGNEVGEENMVINIATQLLEAGEGWRDSIRGYTSVEVVNSTLSLLPSITT